MRYRKHFFGSHRDGSFIIEAVVSLVLLGTALVALTRLTSSAEALTRQADRWVAAKLAGQNVIERFRDLPTSQWETRANAIAEQVQIATGCQIDAHVLPMQTPPGLHLHVTARLNKQIKVTIHDWRLNPPITADSTTDDREDKSLEVSP